jgi:Uma2 family endonuclease
MDSEQLAALAERLGGHPVPGVQMGEREFLDWSLNRHRAEWVDGEVILMAPANDEHDDLDVWLTALVRLFLEARPVGVVHRDMFIRLARRRRRRVPDLMYLSNANRGRIRETFIDGPPDLVFEIVSPDSQDRDRREKFQDYQAAGVREYWIIDPLSRRLDAYALQGRRYKQIPLKDDRVESRVLAGFFLRPRWLFGRQLPRIVQVLKEMGVRL